MLDIKRVNEEEKERINDSRLLLVNHEYLSWFYPK